MCFNETLFSNKTKAYSCIFFAVLTLVNYYSYIFMTSEVRQSQNVLVIRGDYKPEFYSLLLFTAFMILKNDQGSNLIQLYVGIIGFTVIIFKVFKSKSFPTPRIRFFNSTSYILVLALFMTFHISRLLNRLNSPVPNPLIVFFGISFIIIMSMILLKPSVTLKTILIRNYGPQDDE